MTTVYLIRHSKPLKVNNKYNSDSLQIQNEKSSLSIEGEHIAEEKLNNIEFENIDMLFASNYVRAIQTAKYIANKNNVEINIISDLGERKFGVSSYDEIPEDFYKRQFLEEEYKLGNGENQKEVRDRMYSSVMNIVKNNSNKRIAIVSHSTAITFLLKEWLDLKAVDNNIEYIYKNKVLHNGYFDFCLAFKLEFDEKDNVINIDII